MTVKRVVVEQRDDGKYGVLTLGVRRVSAIANAQAQAIAEAKSGFPQASVYVERMHKCGPRRDKWEGGEPRPILLRRAGSF